MSGARDDERPTGAEPHLQLRRKRPMYARYILLLRRRVTSAKPPLSRTSSRHKVVPAEDRVQLVDYRLREGARMVGPLLGKLPGICDCPSCRTDILAHSLNRFSPRYGVLAAGKSRLQPHDLDFIRHEMIDLSVVLLYGLFFVSCLVFSIALSLVGKVLLEVKCSPW